MRIPQAFCMFIKSNKEVMKKKLKYADTQAIKRGY
jgi:hypothetical protein